MLRQWQDVQVDPFQSLGGPLKISMAEAKLASGKKVLLPWRYEATNARRPVNSVSETVDRNQFVWFGPSGSGVAPAKNVKLSVHGNYLPLERKGGVFEIPSEVLTGEVFEEEENLKSLEKEESDCAPDGDD